MDILSFLKEKKNEVSLTAHPYTNKDNDFKYIYCFGLGIMACGHMKSINETKEVFNSIQNSIDLPQEYRNNVIIDINNNFENRLDELLHTLNSKERQYTFISDLLRLSAQSLWSQQFCDGIIETFMSIFKLTQGEREFLTDFMDAASKESNELAKKVYNSFVNNGYTINYKILKYISGNFILEDNFNNITLERGESLTLDKPTTINGDILITQGSTLIIDGADIKIKGSIRIDGGRLRIKKAFITVIDCKLKSFITINNVSVVKIENLTLDCSFKCGFIHQYNGYLYISNSQLLHSKLNKGIIFTGNKIFMENSSLEDCLNGGIQLSYESKLNIVNCRFYNCEAEQGGAIYSESMYDCIITNTIFKNCRAKYLGGAIYFSHKKYGQEIISCEFIKCVPQDSAVFNEYILKE